MNSVTDSLRADARRDSRRTGPAERLELALALGARAIAAYAAAHSVDRSEARRRLEAAIQRGRRPSRVMRDAVG